MNQFNFVHVNEVHFDTAEIILRLLARNGFGTRLSQTRKLALQFYAEHNDEALLFDYMRPDDLSVVDFVKATRDINPCAQLILMSSLPYGQSLAVELGIPLFLPKPFYPEELTRVLRRLRNYKPVCMGGYA